MPDALIIAVLRRLHRRASSLADLQDVVPIAQRQVDWVHAFVEHPLATLIRWGLVDAHQGSIPLTADELVHVSRDHRIWDVEFRMSATAIAIEQALGKDF